MKSSLITFYSFLFLPFILGGCKYKEFIAPGLPNQATSLTIDYPLNYVLKQGFSGSIKFSKLEDGTSLASLNIQGTNPAKRYFGKITQSNALDNQSNTDIADLNELNAQNGTSTSWINKNYNNETILYDSLITSNSMVRVLELDEQNILTEVLRGDIGSNLLTDEKRTYPMVSNGNSTINGNITFQKRLNGKYLLKTELEGLDSNNNGFYSLALYTGDLSIGSFTKTLKIAEISQFSPVTEISVNNLSVNLSELDDLAGFWGLATSDFRSDSVVSYHNFRGNTSTGRFTEYDIFKETPGSAGVENDTVVGKIKFEERPGGKVRTTFTGIQNHFADDETYFITISTGSTLVQPIKKPFNVVKIPASLTFVNDFIRKDSTNQLLNYDDVSNWDAHLRITTDTINFTSTLGLANLGGNEILDEEKTIPMTPINGSICEGTFIIKKRKSGAAIGLLTLTYREPFTDHIFTLRQGNSSSAAPTDAILAEIQRIDGGNGGDVKSIFDLNMKYRNNQPITYSSLISTAGYFEFAILDGPDDLDRFPLASGDNNP
jgi:hypothetical protein